MNALETMYELVQLQTKTQEWDPGKVSQGGRNRAEPGGCRGGKRPLAAGRIVGAGPSRPGRQQSLTLE